MKALILVDIQNDFLPGGALASKNGNKILPIVNKILNHHFDLIVATKDWHPADHESFAQVHNKTPGEVIDLHGLKQILWPVHCVQNSHGAEFSSGWDSSKVEKIFFKGTDKNIDSYSTFFDNGHRKSTGLEDYLRKKGIDEVYIAGLTTEYCVLYSALDALNLGFKTFIVVDACSGVNLNKDDSKNALERMESAGANLITSDQLQ